MKSNLSLIGNNPVCCLSYFLYSRFCLAFSSCNSPGVVSNNYPVLIWHTWIFFKVITNYVLFCVFLRLIGVISQKGLGNVVLEILTQSYLFSTKDLDQIVAMIWQINDSSRSGSHQASSMTKCDVSF